MPVRTLFQQPGEMNGKEMKRLELLNELANECMKNKPETRTSLPLTAEIKPV